MLAFIKQFKKESSQAFKVELGIKTQIISFVQSLSHFDRGTLMPSWFSIHWRVTAVISFCKQDNCSFRIPAIKSRSIFSPLWRRDYNFFSHFIFLFFNQPVLYILGNKTTTALGTVFCILISLLLIYWLGSVINRLLTSGGGGSSMIA